MTGFRMHSAKLVLMSSNLERRRSAETRSAGPTLRVLKIPEEKVLSL